MAAELTDERAAFEQYIVGTLKIPATKDEQGAYTAADARTAWHVWKKRAALATQPPAQGAEPGAWAHEDDPARVISATQKAQTLRDGGASASSVRPYSVALYTAPPPTAEVEKDAARWRFMEANHFQHFTPTGHWKVTDEHGRTIREGTASNFKDAVDAALQSEAQAGKGE